MSFSDYNDEGRTNSGSTRPTNFINSPPSNNNSTTNQNASIPSLAIHQLNFTRPSAPPQGLKRTLPNVSSITIEQEGTHKKPRFSNVSHIDEYIKTLQNQIQTTTKYNL